MSKRRERAKAPAVKLSKQLVAAEIVKRNHVENQKKNLRYADILSDLAKLVFGGVISGGVLEYVLLLSTSMIVRDWRANRQRTVIFLRLTSVLGDWSLERFFWTNKCARLCRLLPKGRKNRPSDRLVTWLFSCDKGRRMRILAFMQYSPSKMVRINFTTHFC